jgi:hypothetical protein
LSLTVTAHSRPLMTKWNSDRTSGCWRFQSLHRSLPLGVARRACQIMTRAFSFLDVWSFAARPPTTSVRSRRSARLAWVRTRS